MARCVCYLMPFKTGVATFFAQRVPLPETRDALADLISSWEEYLTFLAEAAAALPPF